MGAFFVALIHSKPKQNIHYTHDNTNQPLDQKRNKNNLKPCIHWDRAINNNHKQTPPRQWIHSSAIINIYFV